MKNEISVQKFKNHLKANNFTALKMHEILMYGQQQYEVNDEIDEQKRAIPDIDTAQAYHVFKYPLYNIT